MTNKITLISFVAESPGVVTEALEYLSKKFKGKIIYNIVLYPNSQNILWRINFLKRYLKSKELKQRIPNIEKNIFIKLNIEDVKEEKDIKKVLKVFEKTIKIIPKNSLVVYNITGGRKILNILLLDYLRKKKKKGYWINIVSYIDKDLHNQIEDKLKTKIEESLEEMITKDEIDYYLFSKGNYKVFEFKL